MWRERAEIAPVTWNPITGGRRSWICFEDDREYDLGLDTDRVRFKRISSKMLSGNYYPKDAVLFFGKFREDGRNLATGDRVFQIAPLFMRFGWTRSCVRRSRCLIQTSLKTSAVLDTLRHRCITVEGFGEHICSGEMAHYFCELLVQRHRFLGSFGLDFLLRGSCNSARGEEPLRSFASSNLGVRRTLVRAFQSLVKT